VILCERFGVPLIEFLVHVAIDIDSVNFGSRQVVEHTVWTLVENAMGAQLDPDMRTRRVSSGLGRLFLTDRCASDPRGHRGALQK
jgi:hypothetical protein